MLRTTLISAFAVTLSASVVTSQNVQLAPANHSPTDIVKKYEEKNVTELENSTALSLADAYNKIGNIEKAQSVYASLYKNGRLQDKNLAKYGLVLLKLNKTQEAQSIFEKYALTNAEEAAYFLDICATSSLQTRGNHPPRAIRISDIPAYKNYPQVVSETKAVAVSNRTVEVVKDIHRASSAKIDLAQARRVGVNELFPAATNVYFIQLASLSKSKGNIYAFQNLVSLGNIYKVRESGKMKIKLGFFYDQWKAENILSTVKSQGYSDAFITENNLNTGDLELALSSHDVNYSTNTTTTNNTTYSESTYSAEKVYKVRLASYEDPIWFDIEKARKMGHIEQWTKGAYTIFILSGFNNYDDARVAKEKAVTKGFVDAEVVLDNGGVLERM